MVGPVEDVGAPFLHPLTVGSPPGDEDLRKCSGGVALRRWARCGCVETDRGKTVTKPFALSLLGLPLSEKQIPQVVENLESGGKSREALETA